MTDIAAPLGVPAAVSNKIAQLRSRVVLWLAFDGLFRILWLVVGVAVFDFAIDAMFHLDFAQRAILLVVAIAGIAYLAYRWLIQPMGYLPTDAALCHEVERSHPELGEALITSFQFASMPAEKRNHVSAAFVDASVKQGIESAGKIEFGDALNSSTLMRNGVLVGAAAILLLAGGVAIASTEYGAAWFKRNVLLSKDTTYPQQTYFQLLPEGDEPIAIPRGENHTQIVLIDPESKTIPEEVFLDFQPARGRPSVPMKRAVGDEKRFSAEFKNVIEPFKFRARAGNSVSPWREVVLVEQPTVTNLQVSAEPPAYTGEKLFELPQGAGPFSLLRGTRILVAGKSNKDLVGGTIEVTSSYGKGRSAEYDLTLNDQREFSASLAADEWLLADEEGNIPRNVRLRIVLNDTDGLTSKRPTSFGVRVKIDRAPKITVEKVGVTGIVTPKAVVPLLGKAEDDYAITALGVEFEMESGESATTKKESPIQGIADETILPAESAEFLEMVEIADLELKAGDRLRMIIAAKDNDNVSGPNIGRSIDLPLRIVTEDELRTDLLRREKEQRQEFERLIKEQEDLQTDTLALAAEIANNAEITTEQKQQLMTIQRRQKLIANNLMIISDRIETFLQEIVNNRLEEEDGPLQRRLTREIIDPMREIAEVDVTEAVRRIDESRRLETDPDPRDIALQKAGEKQEEIIEKMREVLKHLVKAEGYQEAINLLYEIQKAQQGVFELTQKERQERIRRILEGGGDVEPEPDPAPEDTDGGEPAPK